MYRVIFPEGKAGRCVGLTTLSPLCADCLDIWEPQTPGTLRPCPGPVMGLLYLYLYLYLCTGGVSMNYGRTLIF